MCRYDDLRFAGVKRAGGGAGTTMVNDDTRMAEELVMGNFTDDLDMSFVAKFWELGPTALHDYFLVDRPMTDEALH